jgi:uncharacterized protein
LATWSVLTFAALAAPPELTDRVVDQAGVIPADVRAAIATKSEQLEAKSGVQLVVATVSSLEGRDIESYSVDLARAWKLGEKTKNNGLLVLVAPNERKARIEVGYGLEGVVTDAISSIVIRNAMAPRFKQGDYGGGIARAVDDLVAVVETSADEWQKRPDLRAEPQADLMDTLLPLIVMAIFLFVAISMMRNARAQGGQNMRMGRRGGPNVIILPPMGGGWGGGGGGGFGGGGFSGGGGSFGGGGASGDW